VIRVSRSVGCSLSLLLLVSFGAMPASAADPMIALDGKTRSAIADKSEFASKDAATHESLEVDLHGKTLDTIRPGDTVDLNGEQYTLTSIAQELEGDAEIAGLGFAIGAIMKFKQHKDNPTQRP
jgi:hypothetical protein